MSSMIRQFTARAMYPIRESPVAVTGDVLEGAVTGALTGHLAAKGKLDLTVKGKKVPMDALLGLAGSYAATFMGVPHIVRRTADRLTTIAAHRMSANYATTGKFHGDEIEDGLADAGIGADDPVMAAAAGL
jgi:hypothetical protein